MTLRRPLEGLTVIELADDLGAYAGKFLAGAGARVIKIEPPGGSPMRRRGPFLDDEPGPERSLYYAYYSTGKQSVVLNLADASDVQRLRRLCAGADIVLDGLGVGATDTIGVTYDSLRQEAQQLIWVAMTPFGQTGPWARYRTSDLVSLALGGPLNNCGYDDHTLPPIRGGGNQAYNTASHVALIAVQLALLWRERTGHGQHIDVSMHDACATTVEFSNLYYLYNRVNILRQTGRHAAVGPTQQTQHECGDGRYVNGTLRINEPKTWQSIKKFAAAKGLLVDLDDPAYDDPDYRKDHAGHIYEVIASLAAICTAEEYYHLAQASGMVIGVIRAPEDLTANPHLQERRFFEDLEPVGWGRAVQFPGAPYRSEGWDRRLQRPPTLGEHTDEITRDLGGQ